jgi:hypothetical protein
VSPPRKTNRFLNIWQRLRHPRQGVSSGCHSVPAIPSMFRSQVLSCMSPKGGSNELTQWPRDRPSKLRWQIPTSISFFRQPKSPKYKKAKVTHRTEHGWRERNCSHVRTSRSHKRTSSVQRTNGVSNDQASSHSPRSRTPSTVGVLPK